MSRANPQATVIFEKQLVPRANRLIIRKNNQRVTSDSNITNTMLRFVVGILKHHKPVSLTATVPMPPPDSNKPYTKPPTEKQIMSFIKTLRYDEDPKTSMTFVLTFVATRLRQPWRAILSVLNRSLIGKDTNWDTDRLPILIKFFGYYKTKKAKSKKTKAVEELKEQHVFLVKSGQGKGYMRLGDQEANVPSAFNKNVMLRKTRSLIVADNIVQEPIVVALAKSISIEEQRYQQREIMTQLRLDRQIDKDVEDTYAEIKQVVGGEGSSATYNKYYEFEDISATDSEATRDFSCSDTDEEKYDENDDSDAFDIDLSTYKPQGGDDAVGYGVFMYHKSTNLLKSTYLSPTVTCSSLEYI
ncbi:hypothetical protein Tco_1072466 [Tanacetum coccineum]